MYLYAEKTKTCFVIVYDWSSGILSLIELSACAPSTVMRKVLNNHNCGGTLRKCQPLIILFFTKSRSSVVYFLSHNDKRCTIENQKHISNIIYQK